MGRGAWITVKKGVRCPECYPEDYENEVIDDGKAVYAKGWIQQSQACNLKVDMGN